MNAAVRVTIAVSACALLAGCATPTRPETSSSAAVRIYTTSELSENRYRLVKRLWIDSARSAFVVPEHASAADGVAALQTEAARLGANGLIMVACYRDDKGQLPLRMGTGPVFICYGNAIRVRE